MKPSIDADEFEALVNSICRKRGLDIDGHSYLQLRKYVDLLLEWNEKVNLISRSDIQNVWQSHILHSLSILLMLEIPHDTRILDLGSGGGLPGIPISIIREDMHVTLLDSIKKKTNAVQNIVDTLSLPNVNVITGRAEEIAGKNSARWNMIVSRAVAPMTDLIEWSRQLLNHSERKKIKSFDGKSWETPVLVALKGGDLAAEIQMAGKRPGVKNIRTLDIRFDGNEIVGMDEKKIVIVQL